jgi:hypothetical protein
MYIVDLFKIALELSPRLFEKLTKHLEAPPILLSSFLRWNSVQGKPYSKIGKYIIFPIFFHLYRAENGDGDRWSQEHLKNPKTSRGS